MPSGKKKRTQGFWLSSYWYLVNEKKSFKLKYIFFSSWAHGIIVNLNQTRVISSLVWIRESVLNKWQACISYNSPPFPTKFCPLFPLYQHINMHLYNTHIYIHIHTHTHTHTQVSHSLNIHCLYSMHKNVIYSNTICEMGATPTTLIATMKA